MLASGRAFGSACSPFLPPLLHLQARPCVCVTLGSELLAGGQGTLILAVLV